MKVRDLIRTLKTMNGNRLVVLQRDAEGNGYEEARCVDDNAMYSEGEVKLERLDDELVEKGFCEDDVADGGEKCVVIAP